VKPCDGRLAMAGRAPYSFSRLRAHRTLLDRTHPELAIEPGYALGAGKHEMLARCFLIVPRRAREPVKRSVRRSPSWRMSKLHYG